MYDQIMKCTVRTQDDTETKVGDKDAKSRTRNGDLNFEN